MISLKLPSYWQEYLLVEIWTGDIFCEGVENLLSPKGVIILHCRGEQIKKFNMDRVYIMEERDEGVLKY
jgi:hypothetical protein